MKVFPFGLAAGITWALFVLLVSLAAILRPELANASAWIASFYIGYDTSLVGIIIGMVWALVDGFVGGAFFAWLYNLIARR